VSYSAYNSALPDNESAESYGAERLDEAGPAALKPIAFRFT
jgi:hypothetical protein